MSADSVTVDFANLSFNDPSNPAGLSPKACGGTNTRLPAESSSSSSTNRFTRGKRGGTGFICRRSNSLAADQRRLMVDHTLEGVCQAMTRMMMRMPTKAMKLQTMKMVIRAIIESLNLHVEFPKLSQHLLRLHGKLIRCQATVKTVKVNKNHLVD